MNVTPSPQSLVPAPPPASNPAAPEARSRLRRLFDVLLGKVATLVLVALALLLGIATFVVLAGGPSDAMVDARRGFTEVVLSGVSARWWAKAPSLRTMTAPSSSNGSISRSTSRGSLIPVFVDALISARREVEGEHGKKTPSPR